MQVVVVHPPLPTRRTLRMLLRDGAAVEHALGLAPLAWACGQHLHLAAWCLVQAALSCFLLQQT